MSVYRSWTFRGCHEDGSPLTSKEIEALVAFDEFDLQDLEWEQGDDLFGWGDTESIWSYDHIEDAIREFKMAHPEIRLTVTVQYESEPCPDAFFSRCGETAVHTLSSRLVFFDDETGEEVDI